MHFITVLSSAALVRFASAATTLSFKDFTAQVPCGINGMTCAEPFCVGYIQDIYGCNGTTDHIGGTCLNLFGASSTTLKVCGDAHIYANGCHLKDGKDGCIDFRNPDGDFGSWIGKGDGKGNLVTEDFQAGKSCADQGLGDC